MSEKKAKASSTASNAKLVAKIFFGTAKHFANFEKLATPLK